MDLLSLKIKETDELCYAKETYKDGLQKDH